MPAIGLLAHDLASMIVRGDGCVAMVEIWESMIFSIVFYPEFLEPGS